jgi:hypothetical protein
MNSMNRRAFFGRGIAIAATTASLGVLEAAPQEGPALAFGNRAHIFASPKVKEKLIWCFSEVLGCGPPMSLNAPGLAEPILAFRFPGGGSFSVEFTEEALDGQRVRRGAWLEIWCNDPAALKRRILDAGLPQVVYPATNTFYFAAPGGQVIGVVSGRNPSGGELRSK